VDVGYAVEQVNVELKHPESYLLQAAVSFPLGVVFEGEVMARADDISASRCTSNTLNCAHVNIRIRGFCRPLTGCVWLQMWLGQHK
jgi:hypothetical protein